MPSSPKHRRFSSDSRPPLLPRLDVAASLVSSQGAPQRRTRTSLKPRKQSARSISTKTMTSHALVANYDAAEEITLPLCRAAHYSLDESSFSTPVGRRSRAVHITKGRGDPPLPTFPVLPLPNASGWSTDGATPPRLKLMPTAIALAPRVPIALAPKTPCHGALSCATLLLHRFQEDLFLLEGMIASKKE